MRPLPRNVRKPVEALPKRVRRRPVGKRTRLVAGTWRQNREPASRALTPTPPPVAVELDDAPLCEPSPARAARPWLRWVFFALLAIAAVAVVVWRSLALGPVPLASISGAAAGSPLVPGVASEVLEDAAGDASTAFEQLSSVSSGRTAATSSNGGPVGRLKRKGYASIPGGVLFTPEPFQPDGSDYDLLIHFHGNTGIVRESAERAGLNAAVAVINLGVGSAPYEAIYEEPGSFGKLLEQIDKAVERRGLPGAKHRRLALSSWSAGYGAISTVLKIGRDVESLDAVMLMDGLHCGYEGGRLNRRQLGPFEWAARRAAADEILFSITHSEISPPTYASAATTATHLLEHVGAPTASSNEQLPHLSLEAAVGAVAKRREKRMESLTESRLRGLHVRGYRGETPEHHMAHLFQMGATVLPELAQRWAEPLPE